MPFKTKTSTRKTKSVNSFVTQFTFGLFLTDERKNLVSIESDDENIYVSQNIVGGEAWLGLNKNEDGKIRLS